MSEILENSHFWFAVYTRPKLEAVAVENLIAQGLMPIFHSTNSSKKMAKISKLFLSLCFQDMCSFDQ